MRAARTAASGELPAPIARICAFAAAASPFETAAFHTTSPGLAPCNSATLTKPLTMPAAESRTICGSSALAVSVLVLTRTSSLATSVYQALACVSACVPIWLVVTARRRRLKLSNSTSDAGASILPLMRFSRSLMRCSTAGRASIAARPFSPM